MKKILKGGMLFMILLTFMLAAGCDSGSDDQEQSGPRILFVGNDVVYDAGQDDYFGYAGYWENGERTNYSEVDTEAYHALYENSSICVAGVKYYNGDQERACYWLDGELTFLEDEPVNGDDSTLSYAGIARGFDGSIYVAGAVGYGPSTGCYWKDGARSDLDGSVVHDVIYNNGDAYAFGYYNGDTNWRSCYWKNGARVDLYRSAGTFADGRYMGACTISGTELYIPCPNGYFVFDMSDDSYTFVEVTDASFLKKVKNISGDIYAVGSNDSSGSDRACLWINGTQEFVETTGSEACDVALFQESVYLCGIYKNTDGDGMACYWKDGARTALTENLETSAGSILVIE